VLNMIFRTETAIAPSLRSGLGACMPALLTAATPASKCAVTLARPRNVEAYQPDSQKFAHTTLTIADGAGDLGPHPAREPV